MAGLVRDTVNFLMFEAQNVSCLTAASMPGAAVHATNACQAQTATQLVCLSVSVCAAVVVLTHVDRKQHPRFAGQDHSSDRCAVSRGCRQHAKHPSPAFTGLWLLHPAVVASALLLHPAMNAV
jgi:hypothetical protein